MQREPTKADLVKNAGEDRDYLKGKDLSKVDQVGRTKPPQINDQEDDFKFMQIDVDYYTA